MRVRFSVTDAGSSRVERPRLSVSNGGGLTPPRRVEKASTARASAKTGRHSGTFVSESSVQFTSRKLEKGRESVKVMKRTGEETDQ
jgi:hypothetical protein